MTKRLNYTSYSCRRGGFGLLAPVGLLDTVNFLVFPGISFEIFGSQIFVFLGCRLATGKLSKMNVETHLSLAGGQSIEFNSNVLGSIASLDAAEVTRTEAFTVEDDPGASGTFDQTIILDGHVFVPGVCELVAQL